MNNLHKYYNEKVAPSLKKKLGVKNIMAVPSLKKLVINVGIGSGLKDNEYMANVKKTLTKITGQKPVETIAKKAISNFKIREGMVVGVKVTLRGERMWDFVEKLIKVSLARVRDFRGVSATAFDNKGNYALGFKENISFPEILQDEVERLHGLEVIIATSANNKAEGKMLLTELGFPFQQEENKS